MKMKILKCVALVMAMVCILCFPVPASATSQGTDGTELEVIQPSNLEIQLGESWAGVEFELKTDAGMYPGVIIVGEDGVLRLEIGGSENYILSCLNSTVEIPIPGETVPVDESTETVAEPTEEAAPSEEADPTEDTTPDQTEPEEVPDGTVAGIPLHISHCSEAVWSLRLVLWSAFSFIRRSGKTTAPRMMMKMTKFNPEISLGNLFLCD